jgi:predicted acetyltransferase
MKPKLKIVFYKRLSPRLDREFNTLMNLIFRQSMSKAERKKEDEKFCSQNDRVGYVFAMKNNEIIGAVIILKRQIKFEGTNIVLGGIGGVAVIKKYRQQGIASSLLKRALSQLKKESCDLAYLCTFIEKLGRLYQPFGFVPLGRQYTFLDKSGNRYFEADAMIAPINSPKKFHLVLSGKEILDIGRGNW